MTTAAGPTSAGPTNVGPAQPDLLGDDYEAMTISLPDVAGAPVVATLVRRRAPQSGRRAVLYVHGFADYFFQTELADFHVRRGTDFYAIDLRRYGRSLLPGQLRYDMSDVADYAPDLDAALAQILADGHDAVTLVAHSTGGLIAPLWLASRPAAPVDAMVLNSPFLEINADRMVRAVVGAGVDVVSRYRPAAVLPMPDPGWYGRAIHVSGGGEWDFNLEWKPLRGAAVRLGWLAAIRRAQARLHRNLGLSCPILVLCSAATFRGRKWTDEVNRSDSVLDADRIADLSTRLGRNVTCVRVPDALHDVLLSPPAVRAGAYAEIDQWLGFHQAG